MSQQPTQPEQQEPKFQPWFHKFLTCFFFWAFGAFAILFGAKFIYSGIENGYNGFPLVMLIVVNGLLILYGLFLFKIRFDLAAFRRIVLREIIIAGVVGVALCLANYWVEDIAGDDYNTKLLTTAVLIACWSFVLHRYYNDRPYLFKE